MEEGEKVCSEGEREVRGEGVKVDGTGRKKCVDRVC